MWIKNNKTGTCWFHMVGILFDFNVILINDYTYIYWFYVFFFYLLISRLWQTKKFYTIIQTCLLINSYKYSFKKREKENPGKVYSA